MSFRVRFLPDDRTATLDDASDLFLAAAQCDIWTEQPCGARAVCGKCRVRFVDGAPAATSADERLLSDDERADGMRLGCQVVLERDATIALTPQTRAVAPKSFGDDALLRGVLTPNVSWQDGDAPLGVAIDMGTTSLAAALVSLADGGVLATTSRANPQLRYGADVISRIHHAQEHAEGGAQLHAAVRDAMGAMIAELAAQAGRPTDAVRLVACVGNATMTHSALGADIVPLGQAPYEGAFVEERELPARAFGWTLAADATVMFLPSVGHHVGGDTVGAIIACGLDRAADWELLIDLGTNTEVVLGRGGVLIATSTPAGPAFEGATITHGMRAEPGAIDRVRLLPNGRLVTGTVANHPARGLCGSGLIDAVAELHRGGVIADSGYLRGTAECAAAGVVPPLCARTTDAPPAARAVRLDGDVTLTAMDVRQLQLVKGSIAAGIALVLQHAGITADALAAIHVAGTFGSFVRKESAQRIGLIPGIDPERVHFVGNAAGVGARMVLADRHARERARDVGARAVYVELAGHPDYESTFAAAIPFGARA